MANVCDFQEVVRSASPTRYVAEEGNEMVIIV